MAKAVVVAREKSRAPTLAVLLRDSIVYFGGVLAIILTNLVILTAARVRHRREASPAAIDRYCPLLQPSLFTIAVG